MPSYNKKMFRSSSKVKLTLRKWFGCFCVSSKLCLYNTTNSQDTVNCHIRALTPNVSIYQMHRFVNASSECLLPAVDANTGWCIRGADVLFENIILRAIKYIWKRKRTVCIFSYSNWFIWFPKMTHTWVTFMNTLRCVYAMLWHFYQECLKK